MSYPVNVPASANVYKVGTTYKSLLNNGKVYRNDTDASSVLNEAVDNMPSLASAFGGKVHIGSGIFDCKSEVDIDRLDNAYHGIILEGEGLGTQLKFTPTGALTHGIFMRMMYAQIHNMLIQGNALVTNLVKVAGTTDSSNQHNWAVMRGVTFCGPQSSIPSGNAAVIAANQTPTSGQIGLLMEGNLGTSYFVANAVVDNCQFFALDNGSYIKGLYSDMNNYSNIHIGGCNVGFKVEGTQHNFSNFRIESGGPPLEVGTIGIWCRKDPAHGSGGTANTFSNIQGELRGSPTYTILFDDGTSNNRVVNIVSTPADQMSKHNVVDNNKTTGLNFVFQENSLSYAPYSRFRRGYVQFGMNPTGNESGILEGNLLKQKDGVTDAFTAVAGGNGPFLQLTTATSNNSVACVFINNATLGNQVTAGHYPSMHLRFQPVDTTNCRIFIGLWNQFASPAASADVLNGRAGAGLWLDTGVSANWKLMHNDGTGASTVANFPTQTVGDVTYQPNAVTNAFVQGVTVDYGTTPSMSVRHHGLAYDYKTTDIPATSSAMGLLIWIQNTAGGAARTLRVYDMTFDLLLV